jgi:hypothetical protein
MHPARDSYEKKLQRIRSLLTFCTVINNENCKVTILDCQMSNLQIEYNCIYRVSLKNCGESEINCDFILFGFAHRKEYYAILCSEGFGAPTPRVKTLVVFRVWIPERTPVGRLSHRPLIGNYP